MNTLMALPTVVVGLFVFSLIAHNGPFGALGLLYTPWAMVLGQAVLATPIIAALTLAAVEGADPRIAETARSLGASGPRAAWAVLSESRLAVFASVTAGFGRVFAEVGVSMMLGGNIAHHTRNLTTAIALETSKGEFAVAMALGIILLALALGLNFLLRWFQGRREVGA